ncbi:MAG: DNA-processing protein DprA [Desulfobacterales bacterium]|nr:DNA-processing protein DprA [Desulfobacterales bacterium]
MLTHTTQAVLLLTAHFSKPAPGDPAPLSPGEWGRFARWLKEQGRTPEALLAGDPFLHLEGWRDDKIPVARICALLARASALALALEKWQRAGLWVVTRSDPDYPARLKQKLKSHSPPFFFGCGNRQLLNGGGLAVVGSRDIGVIADRLLTAATSSKYRPALMAMNLVLISPFNPEAGFDVGNAMARNKYVYCLADAAVVVHSGTKGGTWNGALEDLRHDWVPIWVKPTDDPKTGNAALVARGARWLPEELSLPVIGRLFERPSPVEGPPEAAGFGDTPVIPMQKSVGEDGAGFERVTIAASEEWRGFEKMSFYEIFLRRLETLTAGEPKSAQQLLGELDVCKSQLSAWLKRATQEGKLKKTKTPVRYAWHDPAVKPKQVSIF